MTTPATSSSSPTKSINNNNPSRTVNVNTNPTAIQPPKISLTPATPNTPLNTNNSTFAQSLPIPANAMEKQEAATSGLARRSSGQGRGEVGSGTGVGSASGTTTSPTSATAAPVAGASSSSEKASKPVPSTIARSPAGASASGSKPATTQKKRRKRKGLAGFLLALGCLSAEEFEDEPKKGEKAAATSTSSAATTKTAATPALLADSKSTAVSQPAAPVSNTPTPAIAPISQPTAATTTSPQVQSEISQDREKELAAPVTAGTTLVGGADVHDGSKELVEAKPEQVVVAPIEPVTLPPDETAGMTSSAVQPPGSGSIHPTPTKSPSQPSLTPTSELPPATSSSEPERTETSGGYSNISESEGADESGQGVEVDEYGMEEEYEDEEDRLIAQGGMGIPLDEYGQPAPLLPEIGKEHLGRKCLVLDLDETLLHSSFKMLPSADYIVPVEIESQTHNVYVIKRPGVDHFLTEMGKIYEVVVFTASLSKYADPVLDMLDPAGVVKHRLFRESCYNHKGNYVKDLSQLGRTMETSIIIDNSPASYIFHPNNAVPVSTWFNDPHDTELTDLCPFLTDLAGVEDVRGVLDGSL